MTIIYWMPLEVLLLHSLFFYKLFLTNFFMGQMCQEGKCNARKMAQWFTVFPEDSSLVTIGIKHSFLASVGTCLHVAQTYKHK